MATRKTAKIKRALKKKGFEEDKTHHNMFWFYHDSKKTSIRTRISHSIEEYGESLLGEIKRQMRFPEKKQLLDFIDCSLSKNDYVKILTDTGTIKLRN